MKNDSPKWSLILDDKVTKSKEIKMKDNHGPP